MLHFTHLGGIRRDCPAASRRVFHSWRWVVLIFSTRGVLTLSSVRSVLEDSEVGKHQPCFDSYTWADRIASYSKQGQDEEAIRVYHHLMRELSVTPTDYIFVAVLKACTNSGALMQGKRIHSHIKECGLESNVFVGSTLIDLYNKCGSLMDARKVFDGLPVKDAVSWNATIAGYAQHGLGQEALQLFHRMQQEGTHPNRATFLSALKACSGTARLEQGTLVHALIRASHLEADLHIGNTLIDMYAKCGSMKDARQVFDELPFKDTVSWSTLMVGYAHQGEDQQVLQLLQTMQQEEGVYPDKVMLLSILKACTNIKALAQGKLVHALVLKCGLDSDAFVGSCLIDMYAKCGHLDDAREVFDRLPTKDLVCWTAMVTGYAQHGCEQKAIALFQEMQQVGMHPNTVTLVSILKACCSTGALEQGRLIHAHILGGGLEPDTFVGNALIYLYATCGRLDEACTLFERLPVRDLVSWNGVIAGCVNHGHGQKALQLFQQMQCTDVPPDKITIITILKACSSVAALDQGKSVHAIVMKVGLDSDISVASTLIDMYAKCGSLKDACTVFHRLPTKNLVTWNAMISGYAQHGDGEQALRLFSKMQTEGIEPDGLTFLAVLFGCSHAGLVEEGSHLFKTMLKDSGIDPDTGHYACVINILGRAGYLQEAEHLIRNLPFPPDVALWMSLLGACRTHENVELGEKAFKCLLQLDPTNASAYILMSSIYAEAGRFEDCVELRKQMVREGVKKEPGCTWIELRNEVHTFVVEDKQQAERKQVYAILDSLKQAIERDEMNMSTTDLLDDRVSTISKPGTSGL